MWKGTELILRLALELKQYRQQLRQVGTETRQEMDKAARSTDGLTSASKRLEDQAERTAEKVVSIGKAAASGDFARAGQEMAGMASGAGRAGTAVGGLGGAVGAAGAALAGYLLVSYKVSEEQTRQERLLRLTGNAAGLLAGEINAMARSVARDTDSTVADARAITEALVATGRFGRTATESVAGAVELFAQASGDTRESVTADFAKMADGVTKWAAAHNEKFNFLTRDQYDYIRALEEAGRTQEALIATGDAFRAHLDGISENLGWMQRAWRAMGQAASWAWEQALNIGRADTTTDKLEDATERVNAMRERLEYQRRMGWDGPAARTQRVLDAMLQEQALLQEQLRLEQRSVESRAAATKGTNDYIAALDAWDKMAEKARSREQRLADALEEVRKKGEAAGKSQAEIARLQDAVRASYERSTSNAKKLTEAEKELLEQRKRELAVGELRNRLAGEAYRAQQKLLEAAREADAAQTKVYADAAVAAQQRLDALLIEEEATNLVAVTQMSMARAVEMTTIARLKERQVAAMGNEAVVMALQREIEARERIVEILGGREIREESDRLRREQETAWQRTWDQVGQSFTDALMRGGRSVRQYLTDLFRTLVLRPILAPIATGIAGIFGGGPASANGVGGALSTLSNLQSLYGAVQGGFSTLGNMVGSIGSSFQYGTTAFSQQSQMLAAQEAGMGTLSGTMSSAAASLGGAMVGVMLGGMISGGYSVIGKSGNAAVGLGTAIGSIFGPVGAVIGGAIGGLVNRVFGRKSNGSGIEGTFGAGDGFEGNTYEFLKGGWFRSSKTRRGALDEDMRSAVAETYQEITANVKGLAETLNLSTSALAGYRRSFHIHQTGLSQEEINQRWAEEFTAVANEQALMLMGTGQYVREGEQAYDTLLRLTNSLEVVNRVFDTLGTELYAVGLVGADAASQLADLFGGLDGFTKATDAYYQAFYSDEERAATTTRQMTEALAALELQMPSTREGFRSLVEAQDLNTEAGRKAYAALITLAPVFDGLMSHADQLQETIERLGSSVASEVQRLRGLLTVDSANSLASLQAQFATSTAAARAGDQQALDRLPALSQAIEAAARLQAVTAADVAVIRGQLAASLSETLRALGLEVPQFANGGLHGGGLRLVGERGRELEVTGPARYFSAEQTRAMLSGGGSRELLAELVALRAEVAGLRAEVRSDVAHNAQTARILARVSHNGEALMTEAVTP